MNDMELERMLKQALASPVEPEEKLNQSIIYQLQQLKQRKYKVTRRLSSGLVACIMLAFVSVSAYATVQIFSAKQVVEHLGDQMLAAAFDSEDAIRVEETKVSGDYQFTLHGLVTGANLSEFRHSGEELVPDRTYAVVSISRQDGTPMPNTTDPDYGADPFFISPLIQGLKPWDFNIATMNGSYSEIVIDGVLYRLIECDQVEIFADRNVYLAISNGSPFYNSAAFHYDEETGEIQAREDYNGSAVLFDLPLDQSKANPAKADAYIEAHQESREQPTHDNAAEQNWHNWFSEFQAKVRSGERVGETIEDSINEVTYDDDGNVIYEYDGGYFIEQVDHLFAEGQVGFTDQGITVSGDGELNKALLFHRDENGVITGRIVILDEWYWFPDSP